MPRKSTSSAKEKLSKSDAIRKHMDDNPTHGPKAVAAALNKMGYKVTAQFVSTVKSNDRRKAGLIGRRKKSPDELSMEDLMLAKQLVHQMGGIDAAKAAVEAYGKLTTDE